MSWSRELALCVVTVHMSLEVLEQREELASFLAGIAASSQLPPL